MGTEIEIRSAASERGALARISGGITGVLLKCRAWVLAVLDRMRRVRELENLARSLLASGVLDDAGLEALRARQRELGLTNRELGLLPWRMVRMAVKRPSLTGRMSPEQDRTLDLLVAHFGASASQVRGQRTRLAQARLLHAIEAGQLPEVTVTGVLLQAGERAHWAEPGEILEERVVSRQYEGGSRGVSIRIAKGVSYRIGAHRGHIVSKRAMVPVSTGVLVLTNKRVVFAGSGKSVAAKWERVVALNVLEDGCVLTTENRAQSTVIRFRSRANSQVVAAMVARLSVGRA